MKREDLYGTRMHELEAHLPEKVRKERAQEALEWGLESAGSIKDRSIPLFNRHGMGGRYSSDATFLGVPFVDDMRTLGWLRRRFCWSSARRRD